MKIHIISLISSLLFLCFLSFQDFTRIPVVESSSSSTLEYSMEERVEERVAEINFEYIYSLLNLSTTQAKKDSTFYTYKDCFYTYKSINNLFRPPIS